MRSLSLPLPLRDTSAWGGYREAVPIPHRYGSTSGALLQYNASRTEFAWAGHAVLSIDEVLVDGLPVGDWQWRNAVDVQGQPVAIVQFGQSQDEGARLLARGRGKHHPRSGALMTNPADVAADVLALAGQAAADGELADFLRGCAADGLEVGGSIEEADSPQTILRVLCDSVGAVFAADMPGRCRIWPSAVVPAVRATVRDGELQATAGADDLANDLTIAYAYEAGSPRASLRLEAPDSIAVYGRRPATLEARWVTSARVAASVGRRLLEHRARPTWRIVVALAHAVRLGEAIAIAHPASPVGGAHTVLARAVDLGTGRATATVVAPVGEVPAIRLASQSAAFETMRYAGVTVETRGGERVLTLWEDNGAPIIGAEVTLDHGMRRYTDAGGRVSFPVAAMPPGDHRLDIRTADGRPLTMTVLIT